MIKIIALIIGHTINIVVLAISVPLIVFSAVISLFFRTRTLERNKNNGADIRALCSELGMSSDSYNKIAINKMHRAKKIALEIGMPGNVHHASPWNTRLALAIFAIHKEEDDNHDF